MLITDELIASLNPCEDRHANYLKHYGNGKGRTLKAFLRLSKITYDDKVWVARRILPPPVLTRWAALCAESVLHVYEDAYPNDDRPRRAVEAALAGAVTQGIIDATVCAAYTTGHAAYAAVYAARAAYAAACAVDAIAYAAAAATYAAYAREAQEKLNLELLLRAYKDLTNQKGK